MVLYLKRRLEHRDAWFWRFKQRFKHRNANGFGVFDIYGSGRSVRASRAPLVRAGASTDGAVVGPRRSPGGRPAAMPGPGYRDEEREEGGSRGTGQAFRIWPVSGRNRPHLG